MISLNFSVDITVNAADRIILYWAVKGRPVTPDASEITDLQIDQLDFYESSKVTYSLLIAAGSQTVSSSLIFDVITRVLYILTGVNNAFESSFLGLTQHGYAEDGCGGLTVLTNGEKLRGISSTLNLSLKDILESIGAIYGTGYSFTKDYNGEYKLRLELLEYFYNDNEILDLSNPVSIKEGASYKESISEDLTFNQINIGYEKYSSDENLKGNLEDFLTETDYNLPISSITDDYSKKSKFIASGRLIQSTFDETDLTKAWKYDDSTFIVKVVSSASTYIPENNQNFTTVSGIDDPSTAYNLRIAPVYNFLNHALIINSVLFGKPLDKVIVNGGTKVNKALSVLLDSADSCLLGDSQNLTRTSGGDINIIDNYEGLRLFNPITHTLTVAMTETQLDLIISAMENNADDSNKNYGYLSYTDDGGVAKQGYVLDIKWNQNEDIAEIETLEKADNYGV